MQPGDVVVRREIWRGLPWAALPVVVIEDSQDVLVVHVQVGTPLGFVYDHPLGVHAWSRADRWQGIDIVMAQRPSEAHGAWFFGGKSTYINLQDPFRRTSIGFDTFDHELDIVVATDGTWAFKDQEHLASFAARARFTQGEVEAIEAEGQRVGASIDDGTAWWLERRHEWSTWTPPSGWPKPDLSDAWLGANLA